MRMSMLAGALATTLALAANAATAAEPRKGHSDYLSSLTERSLREGFPAQNVRLLKVQAGPGRAAAAKSLAAMLGREGMGPRLKLSKLKADRRQRRILTQLGEGGYLEVLGDGSKLRVRGLIDDRVANQRAGSQRIEKTALEQQGLRFVRGALAPAVKLGAEEKLTFLGVRYLYDGEADATQTGRSDERQQVIANIVVFGREVAGLPVVGPGSKVAVWFDNAGNPVGFDIDWPVYRVSTVEQPVVPRSELTRRVGRTTVPLDGPTVRRFECGYVDLGATRRGKQLQSGCSLAFEGRTQQGIVWARTEYIPAGVKVLKEPRWPLANALADGVLIDTGSTEFQRYMTGPKAAPAEPPTKRR